MPGQWSHSLDLRHYLGVVWRRKLILLAVIVLIPAAVYAITLQVPKEYVSSSTLQVRATAVSSSVFSSDVTVSTSTSEDAARLIETSLVAQLAAKELNEPSEGSRELLGHIEAELDAATPSSTTTDFVTITATDENPKRAADIANAFADAVATRRTREAVKSIDDTIELLTQDTENLPAGDETTRDALTEQLQNLRGLRASQGDTTVVVEPAVPADSPVSPHPERNAALGFVFALLLAAGMVPLLDRLDRRVRDTTQLEGLISEPLLATIPEVAFPGHRPTHQVRESFQTLRASLTYFNIDRSLATVLVTSAGHGEGKTTVVTNLGVALAMDDRKVILVDGDLRKPQAAARLGVEPGVGIESVLLDDGSLDEALVEVPMEGQSGSGSLHVLPCVTPPPNPSVLLGSTRMKTLLAELAEQADIVLIDSPPLLAVSDVIPLLDEVSGTVLVARLDHATRDAIAKVQQVIKSARGSVLGVVATGAKPGGLSNYGGYEYGYGYGYGHGYGDDLSEQPLVDAEKNGTGANGERRRGLSAVLRRGKRDDDADDENDED